MQADTLQLNSHILINPEANRIRQQIYTIVKYQNRQYRVLINEYNQNVKTMGFWCIIWMLATICVATLMIVTMHNFNYFACFINLAISGLIILIYAIVNRKDLMGYLKLFAINFFFSSVLLLILIGLNKNLIFVSAAFFGITQLTLSGFFKHQKGKIFVQFIVMGQLTLFSLQVDNIIKMQSIQLMIPLILIEIVLMAASVFLVIYTLLLSIYYKPTYKQKKCSLMFLILLVCSYTCLLIIPIAHIIFNVNLLVAIIPSMIVSSTNSMYLWINSSQLSIIFCTFKEQIVEGSKNTQICLQPKIKQNQVLYRFSENWFGYELKGSLENNFKNREFPQCIVCTEVKANVVWMECGHLSVCSPCCKNMLENGLLSCVLCKQKATEIVRLKQKDSVESKLDIQLGISSQKQENIKYQIIDQYQVTLIA